MNPICKFLFTTLTLSLSMLVSSSIKQEDNIIASQSINMQSTQGFIDDAISMRRQKKYIEALDQLETVASHHVTNSAIMVRVYFEKGLNFIQLGEYEKAEQALNTALDNSSKDSTSLLDVQYEMSKILARTGRVKEAIDTVESLLKKLPQNEKTSFRREQIRIRQGEYYIRDENHSLALEVLHDVVEKLMSLYGSGLHSEKLIMNEILITRLHLIEIYLQFAKKMEAKEQIDAAEQLVKDLHEKSGSSLDHPDLLILKVDFYIDRDPALAMELYEQSLTILKERKPNHPSVEATRNKIETLREFFSQECGIQQKSN